MLHATVGVRGERVLALGLLEFLGVHDLHATVGVRGERVLLLGLLEFLAEVARCNSYCSFRSSSVKIIAACAVPRPMILGDDDGERPMAVTTKESIVADLTFKRIQNPV